MDEFFSPIDVRPRLRLVSASADLFPLIDRMLSEPRRSVAPAVGVLERRLQALREPPVAAALKDDDDDDMSGLSAGLQRMHFAPASRREQVELRMREAEAAADIWASCEEDFVRELVREVATAAVAEASVPDQPWRIVSADDEAVVDRVSHVASRLAARVPSLPRGVTAVVLWATR
jgi:hypothetical protein